MKKNFFITTLLAVLTINLSGCADQNSSLTSQTTSTGAAVDTASGSAVDSDPINTTEVHITVDGKNKVNIPNPALAGNEINISLRDPDQESVLDNCEQCDDLVYSRYCDKCKDYFFQTYCADLSFAGFKEPVHVSSYAIGCMTENNSSAVQFYLKEKGAAQEKKKKGNCLALFVTDHVGQYPHDLAGTLEYGENYLVILDYENKCCYKTQTDFFIDGLLYWNDMTFTDLTGDGRDELVIQHTYNKTIMLEVHRFDKREKELHKILSNWNNTTADRVSFSGHLKDNYKAVLEYKNIGFTETVSLLDAGYKKENLETDQLPHGYEYDDYQFVRLWKNGKLQTKEIEPHLYTLDDVAFKKNKENIPQLRLMRSAHIGHRSQVIGEMYTYFQYDEEKDTMELSAAKFKINKND